MALSDQNGRTHEPSLREITVQIDGLVRLYDERDRRYEERFRAQETASTAALTAAEKLTTSAFAASKDAIVKAEQAQTAYNVSHNDITRKMDAQYKDTLPRTEADSRFQNLEGKIEDVKRNVANLRESREGAAGRDTQAERAGASTRWLAGLFVIAALGLVATAVNVVQLLALLWK